MSVLLHTMFAAAARLTDGQFFRTGKKKAKVSNISIRNSKTNII